MLHAMHYFRTVHQELLGAGSIAESGLIILCGDFNATPERQEMLELGGWLEDVWMLAGDGGVNTHERSNNLLHCEDRVCNTRCKLIFAAASTLMLRIRFVHTGRIDNPIGSEAFESD